MPSYTRQHFLPFPSKAPKNIEPIETQQVSGFSHSKDDSLGDQRFKSHCHSNIHIFFPGHPTACPKSPSPDVAKDCR